MTIREDLPEFPEPPKMSEPSEAARSACAYHRHPQWARVQVIPAVESRWCSCEAIECAIAQAVEPLERIKRELGMPDADIEAISDKVTELRAVARRRADVARQAVIDRDREWVVGLKWMVAPGTELYCNPAAIAESYVARIRQLEAEVQKAVAEEREACAVIAQFWGECECGSAESMYEIAAAIRGRKA